MTQPSPVILAADIGGTNTRVALLDGSALRTASIRRFVNEQASGLEDILRRYIAEIGVQPDAVSLALAGPVNGDTGALTNLHWAITTQGASTAAGGARAVLLNDLQAQGCALPFIGPDALRQIKSGTPAAAGAPCLMIGIGTGMNISPVYYEGARTIVPPAEAGHTTFAPADGRAADLARALAARLGHVAIEDVLSGRGVQNVYEFVSGTRLPAHEIMALAQAGDETALEAVSLMVQALGHFAGDMALTNLPRGGIYLVGGVARALEPFLGRLGFAEAFADKGRFSSFMDQFAVSVIHDDYAALTGAASYALERLD